MDIMDIPIRCKYDALRGVETVLPNPDNPNKHGEEQLAFYARIIQHQGWRRALVISRQSGLLVRGHGALLAAKRLGLPQVPVEYQDYATADDEKADLLADNKLASMSELDAGGVAKIIDSLSDDFDFSITGFDKHEIEKLLAAIHDAESTTGVITGTTTAPAAAIRMLQIFLTVETLPPFMGDIETLRLAYGVETFTDAIVEAVRRAKALLL